MAEKLAYVPEVRVEEFTPGYTSAYEVIDMSGKLPASEKPVRIYLTTADRVDDNLDFDKTLQGSYDSYQAGIEDNERKIKKSGKQTVVFLASAAPAAAVGVVGYKSLIDNNNYSQDKDLALQQAALGAGGSVIAVGLVFAAFMSRVFGKEAKRRKTVIEEASKSGKVRFVAPTK